MDFKEALKEQWNKSVIKTDEETVLKYATRLANKSILQKTIGINDVWYERVNDNELKFEVSDNDYLDKKEIAEVIVKVFNKHGFHAGTLENDGSVYVYVEVQPFIKEFEKHVEECFIDE